MATEQHKPSALDDFSLEYEASGTEKRISEFALRKMDKAEKKAQRGPSIFSVIYRVYGEILFT